MALATAWTLILSFVRSSFTPVLVILISCPPLRLSISFSVNLHARAIDLALFHQILTSNSSLTLHLVCDLVRDMSDLEDNADDNLGTITFPGAARPGDQDEPRPFDLADVPSSVEAEDGLPQSEIFESLFLHQHGPAPAGRTWEQTRVQSTFKKQDTATAINLLHRRSVLRLDDDLYYQSDNDMLAWDGTKHFLDFFLVVGGSVGLHALLPNKVVDHTFSMALNLCLPTRLFRPKFGPSSQLWLAFAPRENLEDLDIANDVPLLSERVHGNTRLSSSHFRMAVMFLAHALSKNPALSIYVMHPYGTDNDLSAWRIKDISNIYSQTTWDLRLDDVLELHNTIIAEWDDWVAAAPRTWKQDGWLLSRAPVAVACRYGQNQPIANSNTRTHAIEARNWHAERSYASIRYVSVAIATDIVCTRVKRWIEVPNEDIIQEHGVVYDSPDPHIREELDLDNFPHRDPVTRRENNVYDKDGRRIPHLHGKLRRNAKPCGLLAFLRTMGHIQCNAILPHFAPFISDIHRSTSRRPHTVNLNDDDPLPDEYDLFGDRLDGENGIPPVLIPSACKFYNEISHRIRPSTALHDIQQGRITSALAVQDQSSSSECDSLKPEKRNGMFIYKDIVVPLASAWSHPNIFQALRPHICVFASQAFPQVYQWTTFGITSLLERLWAYQLPLLEAGNKPRHEAVELCSVLERALAYAHTGNARVLAARLMRPLWLIQSMLEQGLPTFAPSVCTTTTINNPITISAADWPTSDNLNVPAIASKRTQVLTYGNDHFKAYKAGFHIELSINKLSPHIFLQYTTQERHCIVIALVALRSYIADVKTLVATAIKKECSADPDEMDVDDGRGPSRDKDRLKSLQKWLICDHPLGYKDRAYEHLLRCVVIDPSNFSEGLPNTSKEKLSVQDFAARICAMTRVKLPMSVAAPLILMAPSTAVFRMAYSRMLKYAPANSPAAAEKCIQRSYIIAANNLQIQHIPWHAPNTAGRGRPSRKAVHNSWVNLGKSIVVDSPSSVAARTNSCPVDMAAEAAKKA
ncbi:hypothetical protein EV424DRAFT_1354195 [Suillus variegatus]|nr:hypothetical protein EV424DRAFT_1354195 [Suillus variegatus]